MIKFTPYLLILLLISCTDPDTPPQKTQKQITDFVDAYYTSSQYETDDQSRVSLLRAVKGTDLPYVGLECPTLQRQYIAHGELVFTNQPNANFKLLDRQNDDPYSLPEEQTIVFRKMPGTDWEAIISGWGNYYLGFAGINDVRALRPDLYFGMKVPVKYYELGFFHVRYDREADGRGKAKLWFNGDYFGEVVSPDDSWSRRLGYGVGIETNSTDFNWVATMFTERGMTDAERNEYFEAVKNTYSVGTIPDLPYASDINIVESNGKLTAAYAYHGKASEDKAKTEFQWWQLSPDLSNQKMISTDANIPVQPDVKVCVKVYDTQGRSWMFISGNYR